MTCQSFSSLSLDPPLVMVSPAKTSTTWPRIRATGRFAVNVLGAHQREVSGAFARSGTDKFAGQAWVPGATTGAPLLTGSIAHVECELDVVHDAGDHDIVVGRVVALDAPGLDAPVTDGTATVEPLVYFRSGYWSRD
jgi:flavin reductase (DIM6/NTAB) family NADH-FMN oxidoreductase RutF